MSAFIDARILILFGDPADAAADDAVLVEGGADAFRHSPAMAGFGVAVTPGHAVSCVCCWPRSDAARALGRLFFARARGELPYFRRVLVATQSAVGADAVREAVAADPLVSGRFRLG